MKKWEHKDFTCEPGTRHSTLESLGSQGWELVQEERLDHRHTLTMKREIPKQGRPKLRIVPGSSFKFDGSLEGKTWFCSGDTLEGVVGTLVIQYRDELGIDLELPSTGDTDVPDTRR